MKNEQFILIINPELYEKLRIIVKEWTNVSALIDALLKTYCKVNNIDLKEIEVDLSDL